MKNSCPMNNNKRINKRTNNMNNICNIEWVIVRYIKLPTIVWYKVGYDKSKQLKKKYVVLTSMRVSTIFLLVKSSLLKNIYNIFWLRKKIISGWVGTSIPKKYRREPKSFISKCQANFVFKIEIPSISLPIIIISSTYKDIIIQPA